MKHTSRRRLLGLAAWFGVLMGIAAAVSADQSQPPGRLPAQAPPDPPPPLTTPAPRLFISSPTAAGQREWTYHKSADNAHPSGEEQVYLWLMNRARQDPRAEGQFLASTGDSNVANAIAYFQVNTLQLQAEFAGYPAAPPAAFDRRLYAAAKAHSDDLVTRNAQDHTGQFERVVAAGFTYSRLRGNVFSYSTSALFGHAGFNIDWGTGANGMQDGRGHRQAIMALDGNYANVGIAAVREDQPGTAVGPWVITGNYAEAGTWAADHYNRFLVGTVWEDANQNGRFDANEGVADVRVEPDHGSYYAVTAAGGGYAIPIIDAGDYQVTFSGGNLPNPITRNVTVGAESILLDLHDQSEQVITFGAAPTIVVGGTGIVSATGGGSGNPVTFGSRTSEVCSTGGLNGSTVTGVTAGTCTIAANQAGNANYNAAAQVTQNIAVGKGSQTIAFGPVPTASVGGTGTVSANGGASGNPVTFTSQTAAVCTTGGANGSSVTGVTAGTCTIAANQAGNAHYNAAGEVTQNVVVGKGSQAIAFGPAPTVSVGGTGTVSASRGASGNPVTFTSQTAAVCTTGGANGSTVAGVTAGTCIISANQAGNANYNAAPEVTQSFAVSDFCWQCLPSRGGWRAIIE